MSVSANTKNYDFNLVDFDSVTWHTDEYENWHSVDAVLSSFFNTSGFTGVWVFSTAYTVGQIAVDEVEDKAYEVLIAHTSAASGLFSVDRTTNPTFWQVWLINHAGNTANPHSVTLAQVGGQASDATLTAFAALAGLADRLPYFTAADVFALATFTQAGRDLIDDANVAAQLATLGLTNFADLTASNIFTNTVNTFRLSDNGAAVGPTLLLDRLSTSPAIADTLGLLGFDGRDSGSGVERYCDLFVTARTVLAGSEDGELQIRTVRAGTLATRLLMGSGLVIGAATGGDKGDGSVNAIKLFKQGVDLVAPSQAEAEVGTATVERLFTAQRVKQAISALSLSRNVIINGNFDIWQRALSFTGPTGAVTADRWRWSETGPGVVNIIQSTTVPNAESDFSLVVDVTTFDDDPIAAGDFYFIECRVEGYDAMQFAFGAAEAKQLTLSFWVRSPKTGTHCISFRNSVPDRSFIVEYTVNVANAFEYKTITITADTTGTWLTDNGVGLSIAFTLASGSGVEGTAGSWSAGSLVSTVNQVNCMDSAANFFYLSRVQLEIGSVATRFERRSFAQELALCQRYYTKTFAQATVPAQNAGTVGAVFYRAASAGVSAHVRNWEFPVTMRNTPTLTYYNPSAANALWRNITDTGDSGTPADEQLSDRRAAIRNPQVGTDAEGEQLAIQATADAEL